LRRLNRLGFEALQTSLFCLVDVESHRPTVFAGINAFSTDIFYTTASQTTSLGNENRVYLWGLHAGEPFLLNYEGLSFRTGFQYLVFDTIKPALLSHS